MIRNRYKEVLRLRDMLKEAGIPHKFTYGFMNGAQIKYPEKDNFVCSAIEHDGSYGALDDKIEIMGLLTDEEAEYDSVADGLTAEEVFARIQAHWEANN